MSKASVTFNIKVKHFDRSVSKKKFNPEKGKELAQMVGQRWQEDVAAVVGTGVRESVQNFNLSVVHKAAWFFTRVVQRTPFDEEYTGHKPDEDYVWKRWCIKYWGKTLFADEIPELDDPNNRNLFDNKNIMNSVEQYIVERLFKGWERFGRRKRCIRNIRIENDHPRFAMLEYGGYKTADSVPKSGDDRYHGVNNGYSYQAPAGMLRITQAEFSSMSQKDFDSLDAGETYTEKTPSRSELKRLVKVMKLIGLSSRRLKNSDIEKVLSCFSGAVND